MWICTGILLGAMLLTFAFPAAAAPASQAGTGTITGQVLSLDDVPLAAVRLSAYTQDPSVPNRTPVVELRSNAQGQYSAQVPAGTIWMQFETQDILGKSFWGYSNLPVQVAAGQTVPGQDFRVAIRVVSTPPTAVPAATAVPLPGMPTTGAGPDIRLPLAAALGLLMLLTGSVWVLAQRRAQR